MKIDLIIDGEVYLAEPYLGQEECLNCGLKDVCDNLATQPCKIYPSKVVFAKGTPLHKLTTPDGEYTTAQLAFLSSSVRDFNLPTRTQYCLNLIEAETFRDLLKFNPQDLLKVRGFGRKSLIELMGIFERHNILWTKSKEING